MSNPPSGRLAEFIGLAREACVDALTESADDEPVEELADAIVYGVLAVLGGTWVYVPKTDAIDRQARDRAICRDYDGTPEGRIRLSRRWNLSETHVYRILAKGRKASPP
ncbi:Mor transcription activator family protein [Thiocystis violacea]|uniref:Mor transcription activator family protein n=1 Tax=Thiocystis violacea TaxID=13725 RepID=UPI0019057140|nr:Mor transcription activator family protein [Thiocystis violacea]